MTATCTTPGCRVRGQHIGGCTSATESPCDGCVPPLAAPGLAVCPACETRCREALADLPRLWSDLAERPRLRGVSVAAVTTDPGLPLADGQVNSRAKARRTLSSLATWVSTSRAVTSVEVDAVHAGTRALIHHHQDLADRIRDARHLAAQPGIDGTPPAPEVVAAMRAEETRHRQAAELARQDLETGRDLLAAWADLISRHLTWALSGTQAGTVAKHLRRAHADARRHANKSRPGLSILCECGARVPVDTAEIMTCRECGTWGVISWWVQHQAPEPQPMRLSELPSWLVTRGVVVTQGQLRHWVDRDRAITPIEAVTPGRRRLFDPVAVEIVARARLCLA